MATWIERLDATGDGIRLAVKDAIDVEGVPTTAGCRAVAETATPARRDAACLAGARAGGARLAGKTNLHELCFGTTGVNVWYGTPVNPLDPARVPGGSSSGSAVAVATDEADVGFGTDTGGSVRIPAACCGVVGLKTTWGRVPLDGVWPLSPSLDTVGPIARDVAGVVAGMALLEPGFTADVTPAAVVGRLRVPDVDPAVDDAIDRALAAGGFEVVDVSLPGWGAADAAFTTVILREAWLADRDLLDRRDRIDPSIVARIELGAVVTAEQLEAAFAAQRVWQDELRDVFDRVEVLALPTIGEPPPLIDGGPARPLNRLTGPFNLAGTPALALPVPAGRLPASLQLVGPWGGEHVLCATGRVVEAAAGAD